MTPKALKQVEELEREYNIIRKRSENYFEKIKNLSYNDPLRKYYQQEMNKLYIKESKVEDRIRDIKNSGFSTYEIGALKKEVTNFYPLTYSASLGSRDRVVVGYSNALKNYVIVKYTSYNSFMRNVRGCGSLAGTKDISSIKIISKSQYDKIIKQPKGKPEGWSGYSSKNTPRAPELLQLLR